MAFPLCISSAASQSSRAASACAREDASKARWWSSSEKCGDVVLNTKEVFSRWPLTSQAPAPASAASPRRRYAAARFAWYVARRGASSKSRPYETGASMARPYASIAEQ